MTYLDVFMQRAKAAPLSYAAAQAEQERLLLEWLRRHVDGGEETARDPL